MKILIVIDSLASGGAQKLKYHLSKGLLEKKFDVELFIYDSNYPFYEKKFMDAGIKINISERQSKGFSLNVIRDLRSLIKSSKFDFVISSLHAPSIYAAMATFGISKTKLIVCEESSSLAKISFLKKYLFYFSTLIADFFVVNSFHEKELVKKLPGRYKKTKVICNGFNVDSIKFRPKKVFQYKELKKILVIGRVAYPKNGLNLLKSLSLFESRNGWIPEITWIGRKDTDERSSKDHLSIKMQNDMDLFLDKNKQIKQKWTWLEHVDDIYKYYENNDVIVIPSIYEGLPMVLCEAMLSGCFVIASSVCDHPKIIGDNERGILCDPLSPESICIALEKFHELNSEKKLLVTEKARRYAVDNFDLSLMIRKYETLLRVNNL